MVLKGYKSTSLDDMVRFCNCIRNVSSVRPFFFPWTDSFRIFFWLQVLPAGKNINSKWFKFLPICLTASCSFKLNNPKFPHKPQDSIRYENFARRFIFYWKWKNVPKLNSSLDLLTLFFDLPRISDGTKRYSQWNFIYQNWPRTSGRWTIRTIEWSQQLRVILLNYQD